MHFVVKIRRHLVVLFEHICDVLMDKSRVPDPFTKVLAKRVHDKAVLVLPTSLKTEDCLDILACLSLLEHLFN